MKKLWLFLLLIAPVFTGCSASGVRNAYIAPGGSCGYEVYIGAPRGFEGNVPFSKCLPLKDATDLAAQINKDMSGKWSINDN